jgi:hypothetical protein
MAGRRSRLGRASSAPTGRDTLAGLLVGLPRKVIFETEEIYANSHDDLPAKVYVSIGEYENPDGDDRHRDQMTPEAREASLRAEAEFPMEDEVGYVRDLVDRLQSRGYPTLDITFELLSGEYHPTAPPRTISRAVRHLYDAPK